eukprot:tig00000383_g24636.t1
MQAFVGLPLPVTRTRGDARNVLVPMTAPRGLRRRDVRPPKERRVGLVVVHAKLGGGEERREELARELGIKPFGDLRRAKATTLQVNTGLFCNQACSHCHVESSPARTREVMSLETAIKVAEVLKNSPKVKTVDLTGGAPELHPAFRFLVEEARKQQVEVIDRCNLTVLFEPGQEGLPDFLAENEVRVVASLPCYAPENVTKQRGAGVFDASVEGIRLLNQRGYGVEGSGLYLDLVYNPVGPFLPPATAGLQETYKERLREDFGLEFSSLITITNMPVTRFADALEREGKLGDYLKLLADNFNGATLPNVMCRHQVNVRWDGALFDCDFNQAIDMPLTGPDGARMTIFDVDSLTELDRTPIATGSHCYACTAGSGSSCGGALS